MADYETQLNLARDLQGKGFDKLAGATFELGIAGARKHLLEPLEDEERLRIKWIIQRYAFPLGKFSVVEDSPREILNLLNNPAAEKLKSSEKARFIKSQTYIWLGQTYQKTARIAEAIKTFSAFLTCHLLHGNDREAFFKAVTFMDTVLRQSAALALGRGKGSLAHHLFRSKS